MWCGFGERCFRDGWRQGAGGEDTDDLYAEIESAGDAIARLEEQNTLLLEKNREYKHERKKLISEEAKVKQQYRVMEQGSLF